MYSAFMPAAGTNGGTFIWMDLVNDITWRHSGKMATYTNWNNNEPNSINEVCTVMNISGRWGDVSCAKIYGFLCEK